MLPEKIGIKVMAVISLLLFIFFIIGLAAPVFTFKQGDMSIKITVFRIRVCEGSSCANIKWGDMASLCSGLASRARAAAAFMIIGLLAALGATVVAVLEHMEKISNRIIPMASYGATWVLVFISWTIVAGMYTVKCGEGSNLKEQKYKYGGGFGVLVAGWVFYTAAVILWFVRRQRGGYESAM